MKYEKMKFTSEFTNAPTKKEAEKKIKYWKKRIGATKVVFTDWYGGTTGDKYGKNYWFEGYALIPIKKLKKVV